MQRFFAVRGDRGATGVEYALVASLVAVVVLIGIAFVGRSLAGSYEGSTLAIGAAVDGGVIDTTTGTTTGTTTDTTIAMSAVTIATTQVSSEAALRVRAGSKWKWQCPEPTGAYRPVAPETSGDPSPTPVPVCVPK